MKQSEITVSHPYNHPQQVVVTQNRVRQFFSYGTLIAITCPSDKTVVTKSWNYSKTTTDYLAAFLHADGKREILENLRDSVYIYKDNPCLK